ncbi:MAG: transcriptional regulator [Pyrinomonadaceae bacterium]
MKKQDLTAAERFAAMSERLKKDGSFQIEEAKVEISEQVFVLMEDKGISEAELARRLGTSRAYVNKVLQGSTNFTIESLVKIGLALDCELKLEFQKSESKKQTPSRELVHV